MAFKKISKRWRYRHCSDLGVRADYCIVEYRYTEAGWRSVATCHPSTIDLLKKDGVKAHRALLKKSPHIFWPRGTTQ